MADKHTRILVSVQSMLGAIEWILPVFKYIKKHHNGVDIILLIQRKDKKDMFGGNKGLTELTGEIFRKNIYDLFDISPGWVKAVSGLFRNIGMLESLWFKATWKVFNGIFFRMWIKGIEPDVVLMFGHKNALFKELKRKGIKLGFFPTSPSFAFSPFVWVDKDKRRKIYEDSGFDFYLVDMDWTFDFFNGISGGKPVFKVGTPKFDTDWIDYLNRKGPAYGPSGTGSNKSYALLLLKNESSYVFKEINFGALLEEVVEGLLKQNGLDLIIKPHPRQDKDALLKIMGKYGEKRIIVSEESAALLLGKAEFIVAMPSGVILDALIMDKPVIEYFNYEKLNSILKNKYGGIPKNAFGGMSCIDEKGRLTSVFRKMNFVIPADTPDELSRAIEKVKVGAFSCGTGDVRKIFPDNSSKLAAETILSMAKNGE